MKELLKENDFISAIGHQSTAEVLSELIGIDIPMNNSVQPKPGQTAIVFRLLGRIPKGKFYLEKKLKK